MRNAFALIIMLQLLLIQNSYADAARGGKLEKESCSACHASRFNGDSNAIYLRKNRRVDSYSRLISQVKFCEANLGLTWFDDQIMDVVEHLNQSHYHFDNK
ncbi:MAG: cytochrome c [Gammaproteobacteria bacterium]|nr:cytochrome c [Gammaproteobacteria bacterium]